MTDIPKSHLGSSIAIGALSLATAMFAGTVGQAQHGRDISSLTAAATRADQSEAIARALAAKSGAMAKLGSALAELYDHHAAAQRRRALAVQEGAFQPANPMICMVDGMVVIDAVFDDDDDNRVASLDGN